MIKSFDQSVEKQKIKARDEKRRKNENRLICFKKASLLSKAKKEELCVCLSVCGVLLNLHKTEEKLSIRTAGEKWFSRHYQ
jgi:hypothetical protein